MGKYQDSSAINSQTCSFYVTSSIWNCSFSTYQCFCHGRLDIDIPPFFVSGPAILFTLFLCSVHFIRQNLFLNTILKFYIMQKLL